MKHTINGYQQIKIIELGLDCIDVQILRYIDDFLTSGKMFIKIIENRLYFWILYENILKELPVLNIKNKKSLAKRMDKLVKSSILDKKIIKGIDEYIYNGLEIQRYGTFVYFSFNEKIKLDLITNTKKNDKNIGGTPTGVTGVHPQVYRGYTHRCNGGTPTGVTKDPSSKDPSSKDPSSKDSKNFSNINPQIKELTELLYEQIKKNNDMPRWNTNPPNLNKWYEDIEKLHRIDGINIDEIKKIIFWATKDGFWSQNILSGKKLREKFDRLNLQMKKNSNYSNKNKFEGNNPEIIDDYLTGKI